MENAQFRKILDDLYDAVYFVDLQAGITYWNHAAERLTGYSADEVMGRKCSDNLLMHVDEQGHSLCLHGCPLQATMQDRSPREAEVFLHHKNGFRVPVAVRTSAIVDESGETVGGVEVFSENSSHIALQTQLAQLREMALVCPLTGVGNRRFLEERLQATFAEFQRNGWPFGILMMDLDHFKKVNDTHGHQGGDEVLKTVAKTVMAGLRPYDHLGRWGGEEFMVVLPNATDLALRSVGERCRVLVERSNAMWEGTSIQVTVSVGGASAMLDDSVTSLVERADEHLYQSKENGRNRVIV